MASTVQINERSARGGGGGYDLAGVLLIVLGVALMVIGALMMVYLGMTIFEILKSPDETKLVALILEQTQTQDRTFSGVFGDRRIEFTFGEPLRTLLFVLVLVWILGAMLKIVTSIVGAGRELVSAGRRQ